MKLRRTQTCEWLGDSGAIGLLHDIYCRRLQIAGKHVFVNNNTSRQFVTSVPIQRCGQFWPVKMGIFQVITTHAVITLHSTPLLHPQQYSVASKQTSILYLLLNIYIPYTPFPTSPP